MAEGNIPQPMGLVTETVTAGSEDYVNAVSIVAKRFGKLVSCSGYAFLKAGTFNDQITIATVSAKPTDNIFFYDEKGNMLRIKGSGDIIYHSPVTYSSDVYRFFNFTYPCN